MIVMSTTSIVVLVVLAALGFAHGDTSRWTEFRVKYAPTPEGAGVNSFWQIPNTLPEALEQGYTLAEAENSLGATTVCYGADLRVCPLYDKRGTVAGLLLAIPPKDVEGTPYDFNRFPVYERKKINGIEYWTSTYYMVDPKVVQGEGRPNDVERIGEGIWLKSGREFVSVPTDLESIKKETVYTWQNCIPSMGIHYYYNMTREMRCEDAQPYFLLIKDDNIVGLGWQFSGRTTPEVRDYYDAINSMAVQMTVPISPPCLPANADIYGVISIHMYFVQDPWKLSCIQEEDSVSPIPGLP